MVVLGIILALLGLVIPSMGGILKGKKIEQGIAAVSTALEAARMEAITQNIYVWVAIENVRPPRSMSGGDELWVLNFKSSSPSTGRLPSDPSQGKATAISPLTRVEGVSIVGTDKLPERTFSLLPKNAKDIIQTQISSTPVKWSGTNTSGPVDFTRLILFTPRGDALIEDGNAEIPDPVPYTAIPVAQTINGNVPANAKDVAVVLVSGFSGRVTALRP